MGRISCVSNVVDHRRHDRDEGEEGKEWRLSTCTCAQISYALPLLMLKKRQPKQTTGNEPGSRNFNVRSLHNVNFTRVHEIEAMYGRSRVNAKVEPWIIHGWTSLNFYVHARPLIHHLYFIYARSIYTCKWNRDNVWKVEKIEKVEPSSIFNVYTRHFIQSLFYLHR